VLRRRSSIWWRSFVHNVLSIHHPSPVPIHIWDQKRLEEGDSRHEACSVRAESKKALRGKRKEKQERGNTLPDRVCCNFDIVFLIDCFGDLLMESLIVEVRLCLTVSCVFRRRGFALQGKESLSRGLTRGTVYAIRLDKNPSVSPRRSQPIPRGVRSRKCFLVPDHDYVPAFLSLSAVCYV
jgi:hypothetical protein